MEEHKFREGDDVKVVTHYMETGGVTVLVDGFNAAYVSDGVGGDGEKYITVYRTDQYASYRTILAKYCFSPKSAPNESDLKTDYQMSGKKCIIRCECGEQREILPSNLHNVKRCHDCQKKYLKERARERRKKK